eukprot:14309183-Alexandrium_andersonii.AAC.1
MRVAKCATAACLYRTRAKSFLARCGVNPEGNVDRRPSKGSLEAAFELSSEPELPWLSKSENRAAVRNQQGADELVATVRQSRRPG